MPPVRWLTDPAWIANHFAVSGSVREPAVAATSLAVKSSVKARYQDPGIAKPNGNIAVTIAIDPELSVKLMLSHGEFMGVMGDPQQ